MQISNIGYYGINQNKGSSQNGPKKAKYNDRIIQEIWLNLRDTKKSLQLSLEQIIRNGVNVRKSSTTQQNLMMELNKKNGSTWKINDV